MGELDSAESLSEVTRIDCCRQLKSQNQGSDITVAGNLPKFRVFGSFPTSPYDRKFAKSLKNAQSNGTTTPSRLAGSNDQACARRTERCRFGRHNPLPRSHPMQPASSTAVMIARSTAMADIIEWTVVGRQPAGFPPSLYE